MYPECVQSAVRPPCEFFSRFKPLDFPSHSFSRESGLRGGLGNVSGGFAAPSSGPFVRVLPPEGPGGSDLYQRSSGCLAHHRGPFSSRSATRSEVKTEKRREKKLILKRVPSPPLDQPDISVIYQRPTDNALSALYQG